MPRTAVGELARASILTTATSVARSTPTTWAGSTGAVVELDVRLSAPSTASAVVSRWPSSRKTTAVLDTVPVGRGRVDAGDGRERPGRRWPARSGPGPWCRELDCLDRSDRALAPRSRRAANTTASMAAAPTQPRDHADARPCDGGSAGAVTTVIGWYPSPARTGGARGGRPGGGGGPNPGASSGSSSWGTARNDSDGRGRQVAAPSRRLARASRLRWPP